LYGIGDEVDDGQPAIKQALRAAADLICASINELDLMSTPALVANGGATPPGTAEATSHV
jgi:hypothetical protein